jgi:hypothetical protein
MMSTVGRIRHAKDRIQKTEFRMPNFEPRTPNPIPWILHFRALLLMCKDVPIIRRKEGSAQKPLTRPKRRLLGRRNTTRNGLRTPNFEPRTLGTGLFTTEAQRARRSESI